MKNLLSLFERSAELGEYFHTLIYSKDFLDYVTAIGSVEHVYKDLYLNRCHSLSALVKKVLISAFDVKYRKLGQSLKSEVLTYFKIIMPPQSWITSSDVISSSV